jgi:hypothetical protein
MPIGHLKTRLPWLIFGDLDSIPWTAERTAQTEHEIFRLEPDENLDGN